MIMSKKFISLLFVTGLLITQQSCFTLSLGFEDGIQIGVHIPVNPFTKQKGKIDGSINTEPRKITAKTKITGGREVI